jgi:small subunit ribosomal protein S17
VTTKATTQKASPKASSKATGAETDEAARGRKIEVVGEVISDKMDKTISVLIYRTLKHAKYGKYMKRSSVFKAHDEKEIAKIGDVVRIRETRPLSKTKRWKLVEVVETAKN